MKITTSWTSKMKLSAGDGAHTVSMDAKSPGGEDSALSPKQLVLAGLGGCTTMDVLSLLTKHKQPLEAYELVAEAEMSAHGHPKVFTKIHLSFLVAGAVDAKILVESVQLSQTRYCGVSAMLNPTVPISYTVLLNGHEIAAGRADFSQTGKAHESK
ncbi:MAG TPA: OsmC family protein [Bdellovibrionota bacterium]|nr:OsmC family protein [Bdellovibrionota bacterium]